MFFKLDTIIILFCVNILGLDSGDEISSSAAERALNMSLTPPESPSDNLRILARSESFANDAGILDKLQAIKKPYSRALDFQEEGEDGSKASPTKYVFF